MNNEMATEVAGLIMAKKKRNADLKKWVCIIAIAVLVVWIGYPITVHIAERLAVREANANIEEVLEQQRIRMENYGAYTPQFKNLTLKMKEDSSYREGGNCNHGGCFHSGRFSYSYDNLMNLVVWRERCDKDIAQYYFTIPLDGSAPRMCHALTEKASFFCEDLGAHYVSEADGEYILMFDY
ncbi:hypothetical protein AAIR98_001118 [Elusimicrobium simillimum]|uniref:hypothetical protein n=1 Tax=Elusimicrobium simillimum TaxID=3143438 RepID=UPI003C6FEE45